MRGWQTLVAGLLALGGATLVLVGANRQIKTARLLADEQRTQRLYAARMALASQLEDMARNYDQVVLDISNFYSSDGDIGRAHTSLPDVPYINSYELLSALPPDESSPHRSRSSTSLAATAAELGRMVGFPPPREKRVTKSNANDLTGAQLVDGRAEVLKKNSLVTSSQITSGAGLLEDHQRFG